MGFRSATDNLATNDETDTGHANKARGLAHHFENLIFLLNNFM